MTAGRWCSTASRRRRSKKLGREFFRRKGETKWKKGEPPGRVAADLKKPAKPVLADIRYRGSGSLRYDYAYDDGAGDKQSSHAGVDFSWDYEWRGIELLDFDYNSLADRAPSPKAPGNTRTRTTPAPGAADSGALQPAFEGVIDVDRDGTLEAQVRFEEPFFTRASTCTPYDLWGYVYLPERRHDELPTIHGVPTFPTEPVEQSESSAKCGQKLDPATESCTFTYSATMTVTPRYRLLTAWSAGEVPVGQVGVGLVVAARDRAEPPQLCGPCDRSSAGRAAGGPTPPPPAPGTAPAP